MPESPVAQSLARLAELVDDPVQEVYDRLFKRHPEMRALFVLDVGDGAKGHMLSEALECIFNFLDGNTYATHFIASERTNHDGLGVPPEVFDTFFAVMMEAFRELLGADWTRDMDQAWRELLGNLHVATTLQG